MSIYVKDNSITRKINSIYCKDKGVSRSIKSGYSRQYIGTAGYNFIYQFFGKKNIINIKCQMLWTNGADVVYDESGNYTIQNPVWLHSGNYDQYIDSLNLIKDNQIILTTSKPKKGATFSLQLLSRPGKNSWGYEVITPEFKNFVNNFSFPITSEVTISNVTTTCAVNSSYFGAPHINAGAGSQEITITPENLTNQYSYCGIFKLTEGEGTVSQIITLHDFIVDGRIIHPVIERIS